MLLYGSGNRLYYYVDYRLRDIVGDTVYSVNAKSIAEELRLIGYLYI